jgi:hypothetical protein
MQFENQRPGKVIAAPFRPAYGRGDALRGRLGSRAYHGLEGRAVTADPGATVVVLKDRRDAAMNPATRRSAAGRSGAGGAAPSPTRRLQVAAADGRTGSAERAPSTSGSKNWRRRAVTAMSLMVGHLIEGFALSAAALHPQFLWMQEEYPGRRDPTSNGARARPADAARSEVAGRRPRSISVISILAARWSRMLREREIRRSGAAWETIDDGPLRDLDC